MVLNDNSGSSEDSVEDGREPSSSHLVESTYYSSEGGEEMKYDSSFVMDAIFIPSYPTRPFIDPKPAEVSMDEWMTLYFINSFMDVNDQDPKDRKVRDHIDFRSNSWIYDQHYLCYDS